MGWGDTQHQLSTEGSAGHLMAARDCEMLRCCGTHYEMLVKAFWDCTRFITEWLGKEPEVGKGKDEGGLGGNKQKNRVIKE